MQPLLMVFLFELLFLLHVRTPPSWWHDVAYWNFEPITELYAVIGSLTGAR